MTSTVFKITACMCNFGVSFMLFRYATLSALMFTSATDVWHVETEPRLFQHNSFTTVSRQFHYIFTAFSPHFHRVKVITVHFL